MRGDVNGDGEPVANISDVTYLVNYLFRHGPEPPCLAEANINGDGLEKVDVADLTHLIAYLYRMGPAPANCPW